MEQKRSDLHIVKYLRNQNQNDVEGDNKNISKDSGDHGKAEEPKIADQKQLVEKFVVNLSQTTFVMRANFSYFKHLK